VEVVRPRNSVNVMVKKIIVFVALFCFVSFNSQTKQKTPSIEQYAAKILERCPSDLTRGVKKDEIMCYLEYTRDELKKYHLEKYFEVFVANTIRESGMNLEAGKKDLCKGLCQINPYWQNTFEKVKRAKTGKATDGNLYNPYTSIGLGIACFHLDMKYAKQDVWLAIRMYNGKDCPKSRRHVKEVKRIYKKICIECEFLGVK